MCYPSPKTNAVQTTIFISTRPAKAYSFVSMNVSLKVHNIRRYLREVFYELNLSI